MSVNVSSPMDPFNQKKCDFPIILEMLMMYRFSCRCIGFYPKSWKRGLWNGNIGCSQQTKTGYVSCSTRGLIVFQMGWVKNHQLLEEDSLLLKLSVFCVCGGVDSMQFLSTFQSRSGFKKNSGFNQKNRLATNSLRLKNGAVENSASKMGRYHLISPRSQKMVGGVVIPERWRAQV